MEKIGLFGGTFDPFHLGHTAIINAALDFGLDRVIVIPSGEPPHKERAGLSAAGHRFNMARLATAGMQNVELSDFEMKKRGPSYTVETLEHFKGMYPAAPLYFIVGDDSYAQIGTWHKPERLFELCTLLVYERIGCKVNPPAVKLEGGRVQISSSDIRERARRGEDISHMVCEDVLKYIRANKLYGGLN